MTADKHEFQFTDRDFAFLRQITYEHTGINLGDSKRQMVYGRLARRIRQLGMTSFAEYCARVERDPDNELGELVNAITTNLTSFFRENHHFNHLSNTALPEIMARNSSSRRLRVWSAGCSTGEEPYSIAMTLAESGRIDGWDARILATDIDSNVVTKADAGVYNEDRIQGMDRQRLRRWFRRGSGANVGKVRVVDSLREMIIFRQLNLLSHWPMNGPFDVIFCRNVVIYFDKNTQCELFSRFADMLAPDGYLYIGHSENLFKVSERFRLIGNTIYQKI